MKVFVFLGIVLAMGLSGIPAHGQTLLAPVYPGAVENRHSSERGFSQYFTRDPIGDVIQFYQLQPGYPEPELSGTPAESAAFWIRPDMDVVAYDKIGLPPRYAGVFAGTETWCSTRSKILWSLDEYVSSGELPAGEVDRLNRRYEGLGGASPNSSVSERGQPVPQVVLIHQRYEPAVQRLRTQLEQAREVQKEKIRVAEAARAEWEAEENERMGGMVDIEQRRLELMMQGRIMEAIALAQDLADDMQRRRAGDRPVGPSVPHGPSEEQQRIAREILAQWERALEELAPLWYPVWIQIIHHR